MFPPRLIVGKGLVLARRLTPYRILSDNYVLFLNWGSLWVVVVVGGGRKGKVKDEGEESDDMGIL